MEPHAAIAGVGRRRLTVWTSVQIMSGAKKKLVNTLDIDADKARILSPYIGGGFGGKGGLGGEAVLRRNRGGARRPAGEDGGHPPAALPPGLPPLRDEQRVRLACGGTAD